MQKQNPEITRVSLQCCSELQQRSPMTRERWSAVARYVADLLVPSDSALEAALAANAAAALPAHDVSPAQAAARDPRAHARRAADPRDRHARRLPHDLARARARPGRMACDAGARPHARGPRAGNLAR